MKEGEASMTARRVAQHRLGFDRLPAAYGRPADDDKLQADVAAGIEVAPSSMGRYLQARTRFFDRQVVEAIDAGIRQIVVAGAGYDGRSLRYSNPTTRWFELDHPSTQADKLERLERLAIASPGTAFGAVDFANGEVDQVLASLGHDAELATMFFCEGVAPYLPEAVLAWLLSALRLGAAVRSRLAIEFALVPTSPEQIERRARLAAKVADLGEPLRSTLSRETIEPFLIGLGWTVTSARAPDGTDLAVSETSVAFVTAEPAS
ncbi:MAG TPA: SAM-dependent methyltransferase [Acidimicrobiales bacterium]|nr:SAM-dependent methyltransferase [Acidimicrobiales bacterium]